MKIIVPREDWAFHEIPKAEYTAAWEWEIQREAFGKANPWLFLSAEQRAKVVAYFDPQSVVELPLEYYGDTEYIRSHQNAHDTSPEELHLFKINWASGKRKILKSFEKWLEAEHWKLKAFHQKDPGGRHDPLAWLVNLAIYRAIKAGLSRNEAVETMMPLLKSAGIQTHQEASKVSSKHWRANGNFVMRQIALRKERNVQLIDIFPWSQ